MDSAGVRISESTDEIAAFRKVRVMTASEAVHRTFMFNVNFRDPSVVLCRFSTPTLQNRAQQGHMQNFLSGEPEEFMADFGIEQAPENPNNENLFGDLQDYFRRPAEVDEGTTFTEFFRLWYKVSSAPHFQVVEQQRRGPVHWHGLLIATPPIDPLPTAAHDV